MRTKTHKTAAKKSVAGKKNFVATGKTNGKTISIRCESPEFATLIGTMIIVDIVQVVQITSQEQLELAILCGVPVFDQAAWEAGLEAII